MAAMKRYEGVAGAILDGKDVNPNLKDSGGAWLLGCAASSGYDEVAALSLVREEQKSIFEAMPEKPPHRGLLSGHVSHHIKRLK